MPKFSEFLFGNKEKVKKLKTLTPEQEQLMKLIQEGVTSGKGPLADIFGGFNQEEFEKGVSEPALKNFQENILPMLQEKFNAGNQAGGSGQLRAQNKAGTDLQSQLAQLMYQAQQNQKQGKLAGVQSLLGTKSFENVYNPAGGGIVQSFLEGLGKAGGKSIVNGPGGGGGASAAAPAASAVAGGV